jgi:hypothetical protein
MAGAEHSRILFAFGEHESHVVLLPRAKVARITGAKIG